MMRMTIRQRLWYHGSTIVDLYQCIRRRSWLGFIIVCLACSCALSSCGIAKDTIIGRWTGEFYDRTVGVPVVMVLRQGHSGEILGKVTSLAGLSYAIHGTFQDTSMRLIFPHNEVFDAVVHGGIWKGSTVFQGHRWHFAFSRS